MSFPVYPTYRNTGLPWIGPVPDHWSEKPLFAVASEKQVPNTGLKENNLLSLSYGNIIRKDINSSDGLLPASFETYQVVDAGDIIWRLTDLQNDQRSLRTGLVNERGIITSAYLCTRPTAVTSKFLAYLLRAYDLTKVFYSMGGGLRQSMKFDDVKRLPIFLPPELEQHAIVEFLDRETAKIDRLIAEQEHLIALLQEKREAVTYGAVTKGLRPDVPLKASGTDWLGDVPQHWQIKAVWMLFELGRGRVISHQDIADNPGPYPVYSSQTANDGIMGSIGSFDFEGDYLTWTTDGANAGTVFKRSGKFNCTNVCGTLKPKTDLDLDFIRDALAAATSYFVRYDINPKLMNNVMSRIRVAIPPPEEQRAITDRIRLETGHYGDIGAAAEKAVELLRERRSAMISAVVTGKIDVRGLVEEQAQAA